MLLTLLFLYLPAARRRDPVVQHRDLAVVAAAGVHARLVAAGLGDRRAAGGAVELGEARLGGDGDRPRARHARRLRHAALPVLRPQRASFLFVLPLALPGIVTGVALQNTFNRTIDLGPFDFRVGFGFHSLVIAHATFCVVLAYNNVDRPPAPLVSPNLLEASADLGAHGSQTFRYVTFPLMRSAMSPAASWRSPSASTRSSSPRSRPDRATRRCRSGSSPTSAGRTTCPW